MARTVDPDVVRGDKDELMSIGAAVAVDIEKLIKTPSSKIQMNIRHGITVSEAAGAKERSLRIVLLFTVTDLGGEDERKVKESIKAALLEKFKEPALVKRSVRWAMKVQKNEVRGGQQNGK